MLGLDLNMQEQRNIGLVILTYNHMEEGKVPSSMAGSQDALLPLSIGMVVNQIMPVTMKIMLKFLQVENGMIALLNGIVYVAVSTTHLVQLLHHPDLQLLHHPDLQLFRH